MRGQRMEIGFQSNVQENVRNHCVLPETFTLDAQPTFSGFGYAQ